MMTDSKEDEPEDLIEPLPGDLLLHARTHAHTRPSGMCVRTHVKALRTALCFRHAS